ncbi:contractile injection system tape measure protein [Fodinibius salsisoli]|uniref:Uncharacterized protein n=1 Tax=Fodinibius salsisoli TaxID=2820877 RepID=A0ABT3PQP3_9BACT|nr:contractile injection system tape measure protein [Fodinibius salsisoli]MCW9708166.1 hypothetical protein [Fodinibius salsisoli]
MKNEQTHIVDRLRIELEVSGPEQAHEMQEKISQLVEQKLKAMLDDLFDQVPGDQTIVIDRLQLDLGALPEDRLAAQFMEKLQKQVKRKMPDLIHTDGQEKREVQQFSKEELYWEVFRHYLLTGSYPWFVSDHSDDRILKDPGELYEMILRENKTTLADFLNKNGSNPNVRKRLIHLLNGGQFEKLSSDILTETENYEQLKKILIEAGVNIEMVRAGLKNVRLATVGEKAANVDMLKLFFEPFVDRGDEEQLLHRIDQSFNNIKLLQGNLLVDSVKEIIVLYHLLIILREEGAPDDMKEALSDLSDLKQADGYLRRIKNKGLSSREIEVLKEEISQKIADRIGAGEEESSAKKQKSESKEKDSFYITNGGLILLWPFLPKFFRSLELIADRQFIDQASRVKAIHMLQYLASGEQSTYEYVMVFNKVLCGYPIERPFSAKVEFSDNEIEEADELLNAVINRWEALKSTSVQGLQQSFIQRNARLIEQPDQWQLQVESKGYDMLLDKLPWGISVARLPWMEKPIYVNWR